MFWSLPLSCSVWYVLLTPAAEVIWEVWSEWRNRTFTAEDTQLSKFQKFFSAEPLCLFSLNIRRAEICDWFSVTHCSGCDTWNFKKVNSSSLVRASDQSFYTLVQQASIRLHGNGREKNLVFYRTQLQSRWLKYKSYVENMHQFL